MCVTSVVKHLRAGVRPFHVFLSAAVSLEAMSCFTHRISSDCWITAWESGGLDTYPSHLKICMNRI